MSILIWKKRYQTALFALFGGVLYTIVDYGGFYLISHSREIYINGVLADNYHTFFVLLWMSMSYGITNFAFIWTCVSNDEYRKYFLFLIISWWICAPSIASMGGDATITTLRTTGAYHGWMAVTLIISYLILILVLLYKKKPFVNILYLCLIGISVKFCWEFAILIN